MNLKKQLFSDVMHNKFRNKPQFTEKTVRENRVVESEITLAEIIETMRWLMQRVERIPSLTGKEKKEAVLSVLTLVVQHFKASETVVNFCYNIASSMIDEIVEAWNSDTYLIGPSGCMKFRAKLKRRFCCK